MYRISQHNQKLQKLQFFK